MRKIVRSREEAARWIITDTAGIQNGRPFEILVKPFKRRRTLDQNAKMHAMIREVAQHVGYSDGELKDYIKSEYGPKRKVRIGKREVVIPKSTRDYNVMECADIIEVLYMLGAECGCVFQDPENAEGGNGGSSW